MSIRQRLYPDQGSVAVLTRHCSDARFVWNLALEQANCYDRAKGPTPNNAARMRQLTEARQENPWLAQGSTVVQQGSLRDFDRALNNWRGGSHRRPTWRKTGLHEGFVVRDLTVRRVNRKWAQVLVPKAGYVRFRLTRAWTDILTASSARVTFDRAGRWWVALVCPPPVFARKPTGGTVGLDRGVANSVATSDGLMMQAPILTAGERTRFLVLARRLTRGTRQHDPDTRSKKDSHRRARTRKSLARMHARLGDRRKDWIEQTSTMLVRDYDLIVLEALNTRGMTRKPKPTPDENNPGEYLLNGARAKAGLNKAILASCWGGLEQRLIDKTSLTPAATPSVLVKVDPRNTSRQCADCGHVSANNRESQAVFACTSCGHKAHADTNAAINIRQRALNPVLAAIEVCGRTDRERTHQSPRKRGRVNQPAA